MTAPEHTSERSWRARVRNEVRQLPDDVREDWREFRRSSIGVHIREFARGLGLEGLWALCSLVAGIVVLVTGMLVVIETWPIRISSLGPITLRLDWLIRLLDEITLPWFWISFMIGLAITGYWLSGQVSKRWLRGFVGINLLIAGLLVVSIGRNDRVKVANDSATTNARQLQAIINNPPTEGQPDPENAQKIVTCLDELPMSGDGRSCELMRTVAKGESARPGGQDQGLMCLPGWTVDAFIRWVNEASYDRRVVALTAVARCELDAFDPGADVGEGTEGAANEDPAPGSPEQDQGVEEATEIRAAVDARAAVDEALRVQRTETTAYEAVIDGSDGILATISGPTDFAEFRFSGATWIGILALALLWYRKLEIRAGSQALGPVDIVYDDDPDAADATPSNGNGIPGSDYGARPAGHAIFKQAVVQNVPEPGAVPGSQALAPVGDLVASTDTHHKKFVGSIVDLLQTIFATRSGFTVVFASHVENGTGVEKRASADSMPTPRHVAFVRIRDRRTGNQLASMRYASEQVDEAAQLAGYWVAGWIISRSRYVPCWAKWSEHDARSFYDLEWRQGDDLPLQARGTHDPAAVDQHSVNSLILTQRASSFQLSNEDRGPFTFNALEGFARAAKRQPRYPVARYRRAAALSALMQSGVQLEQVFKGGTSDAPSPSEPRFRYLFEDLLDCDTSKVDEWIHDVYEGERQGTFPEEMRIAMLAKVKGWIDEGRAGVRAGLVARLRPSERRFWRDFSHGPATHTSTNRPHSASLRGDWMKLIRTSKHIADQRMPDQDPPATGPEPDLASTEHPPPTTRPEPDPRLKERAKEPDSHWQISYNLACYYSLAVASDTLQNGSQNPETDPANPNSADDDSAREAFQWLQRCLDRPYRKQLVREWAECDPDLKPLRDTYPTEWDRWLRRVPRMPIAIQRGDMNRRIELIQRWLNLLYPADRLEEDGRFGTKTANAVKRFQSDCGLKADGNPDGATQAELERKFDERIVFIRQLLRLGQHVDPCPLYRLLDTDGRPKKPLTDAVEEYQTHHGLKVDGYPGRRTQELLFDDPRGRSWFLRSSRATRRIRRRS